MEPVQFETKLMDGNGYSYFVIPKDLLDMDQDAWVRLTIHDLPYLTHTTRCLNGDHEVHFNHESMFNLGLKPRQRLKVVMELLEVAPQLNDLPADFLAALAAPAMEENYKRLPPEIQRKYLEKVEKAADPDQRAETIREIVGEIQSKSGDLPRGDSL